MTKTVGFEMIIFEGFLRHLNAVSAFNGPDRDLDKVTNAVVKRGSRK